MAAQPAKSRAGLEPGLGLSADVTPSPILPWSDARCVVIRRRDRTVEFETGALLAPAAAHSGPGRGRVAVSRASCLSHLRTRCERELRDLRRTVVKLKAEHAVQWTPTRDSADWVWDARKPEATRRANRGARAARTYVYSCTKY